MLPLLRGDNDIYLLLFQGITCTLCIAHRVLAILNCEMKVVVPEHSPELEVRFIVHDKRSRLHI